MEELWVLIFTNPIIREHKSSQSSARPGQIREEKKKTPQNINPCFFSGLSMEGKIPSEQAAGLIRS